VAVGPADQRCGWRAHTRGPRRWVLAAVAVLVLLTAGGAALFLALRPEDPVIPPAASADKSGLAFGVLGAHCTAERVTALHEAGVSYVEFGIDWSQFEPQAGQFDQGYKRTVKRAIRTCRDAGVGVVLTLGLHSAPPWVAELPAGSYVDQDAGRGSEYTPNVVFSAAVRRAVTDYLTELKRLVGLNSLAAIRVGTGTNGELGYPQSNTSTANPFWAFDEAAQNGQGLADGASVSPMPGWTPGLRTWNGRQITSDDVRQWFIWYSDSVADAVVWVVRELRDLGYTRDIHLPLAGRGALPGDVNKAIGAYLDGTADRDGSLEGGLFYPEQLQGIAHSLAQTEKPGWGRVSADSASVDDSTAVHARELDPPQDTCRPGDADRDLLNDPAVVKWSSFRWTVANARHAGLGVIGENPGPPNAPGTGGNEDTDSSQEQLVHAPRYAQGCGMTLLMWAFEDDLFGNGQSLLDGYAQQIQAISKSKRRPSARTGWKERRR
jgi:hypothetical protein